MPNFNVRVYGILIENECVLVSDEIIKGNAITKFVGGGLEFGEGTIECLKREFKEELDVTIDVMGHFYTTDFFVESVFGKDSQVISIYYLVKLLEPLKTKVSIKKIEFNEIEKHAQSLRWIKLSEINQNDFTLIIDKKVGSLLMKFK